MFIDESGEANIAKPDPRFNIFVLCGIVFREDHYNNFNSEFKALKKKYFNNEEVVFHSIKMRNKNGSFKIFQDEKILTNFYIDIGKIFKEHDYKIISCVVNKELYRERYQEKNHAYEDALTFICERAISLIGNNNKQHFLHLCLEKRDKRKDALLKKCYTNFIRYGTNYVSTDSFKICHTNLHFRGKEENINGLQMADLCAYPIARKSLSPEKRQPTFELIEEKFFCNWYGSYKGVGLKTFP